MKKQLKVKKDKVTRTMIKRIADINKPKVWRPREDYHSPQDGISMSIASAHPSSTDEKSEVAIYRSTGVKCEDGRTLVLQPSKSIITDATCYRYRTIIPTLYLDYITSLNTNVKKVLSIWSDWRPYELINARILPRIVVDNAIFSFNENIMRFPIG